MEVTFLLSTKSQSQKAYWQYLLFC